MKDLKLTMPVLAANALCAFFAASTAFGQVARSPLDDANVQDPTSLPDDAATQQMEGLPEESAADDDDELELIVIDRYAIDADELDDEELEEIASEPLTAEPTSRESRLEELRHNFDLYKSAVAAGSFDEADVLAKRMVELSIQLYGLDSLESARALTNLGLVQHRNKDYESAILNFTASIDIIERVEDRLNENLVNPLRGLGAAQLGAGRPDQARRSYVRAVHITHVNEGPHNLMQIDVLQEVAEAQLALGNEKEALDVHESIYNLEARNANLTGDGLLPALNRQAIWLNRMRQYEKERAVWRKIIDIIVGENGKDDIRLIPPLTGLGKSYLYISEFDMEFYSAATMASGDSFLKHAAKIAHDHPESNWQLEVQTLLTLADYYTMSLRASKARKVYEETWEVLSADDARLADRAAALEQPTLLLPIFPPKYYNSERDDGAAPTENFEVGKIVGRFRVTERGLTRDIEIIEANPDNFDDMTTSVERDMRNLIYRPRMQDGELIDTSDMLYEHEFYYRLSDLPTEEAAAEAEVP